MTDTWGDGWNDNVFGFEQGNQYVATFGDSFTSGTTANKTVVIPKNVQTKIVVYQAGTWKSECGFVIRLIDGTVVFEHQSGTNFANDQVFKTYCPGTCQQQTEVNYGVYLTDSYGDGWNGNTIKFIQGEN